MNRKEFLEVVARSAAGTAAVSVARPLVAADGQASPAGQAAGESIRGATEALRGFILAADLRSMPADAVEQGKRCLVDGFGVILAGSTVKGSSIVREYVRSTAGPSDASVLGRGGLRVPAASAALANGASGHAMDYDDTQLSTTPDRTFGLLTHPTVPALSAALAVAERARTSGAAFLEAFLVGVEVECKIAEAIDPSHYRRGFHSSGTVGTFGAAAAAARLLKLSAEQVGHALTIASSLSSGIRVNFGSMTKPLHVGRASGNGVFAAELAARGFTGGDAGLDGPWGFFQVFGGGADLNRLIPVMGKPYTIVNPGVSIKPYPCGSLSHPSLDAMLKVVTEHNIQPDQVRAVRLRAGTNILEPLRYKTAKTELEAKFCIPFLLSAILLRRRAGMREFTDEFVSSEPVQRMMTRVTGVFDPAIEARGFDRIRSVVEVDLVDGRTLVEPSDERYRGGPEKPFTREELHAKFADCAQLVLADRQIAPAIAAIEGIDRAADVATLVRALTPAV
jgi:2-methylcitrate dehydratase PrpD